jgi:sigma-E factor negative regulatory protein RseB
MHRAPRASERLRAPLFAFAVAAASGAFASGDPTAPGAGDADARSAPLPAPVQWLERMNRALNTRNYDGTFSHLQGGTVEMLRIIHRVQDGHVAERLVALDGSGREFIRSDGSLTCYLPDKRTVLVEERPAQASLVAFPTISAETASFYDIREVARIPVDRHNVHWISVTPRDEYRYGYRLWIDETTAMPLKTQLCDTDGHVIETRWFASLTMPAHIPDSAFRPAVSTEGFQWLRNDAPPPGAGPPAGAVWSALRLPPGFRMMVRGPQTLPGSAAPVDHMVFTDGLASVSVFVETHVSGGAAGEVSEMRAARVGSSSAFSTVVDGRKVTAVGEVPPTTVRFIATQVRSEATPASATTRP